LEWPNLAAFDAWRRNEELAHSIELIKSTVASGGQVWTLRRIFVCSHENGGGRYKYVKKHPERKRKIPSKKTDCPCNIVIKRYLDTERILGRYEREHNHPIGIANVPFTRLSAGSRKWMRDMVSQKIDPREIVCKNIYKIFIR
jgi:FAR1 DNA-binding domain